MVKPPRYVCFVSTGACSGNVAWQASEQQTFKYDQYYANIAQGKKCLLPVTGEDGAQGNTVDEPDDDMAAQRGTYDLASKP